MKYKINIHAHTLFSDGHNTPIVMAEKAKELGFCALVLTDHFYGNDGQHAHMSLTQKKMMSYRRAIKEAQKILPVIMGMEVPYGGEEVLIFGSKAINKILADGEIKDLKQLKADYNCAVVLCHPNKAYTDFINLLDGFEHVNSGTDWFRMRDINQMGDLQRWYNSDAHRARKLAVVHTIVDKNITDENQLINYIKRNHNTECSIIDQKTCLGE